MVHDEIATFAHYYNRYKFYGSYWRSVFPASRFVFLSFIYSRRHCNYTLPTITFNRIKYVHPPDDNNRSICNKLYSNNVAIYYFLNFMLINQHHINSRQFVHSGERPIKFTAAAKAFFNDVRRRHVHMNGFLYHVNFSKSIFYCIIEIYDMH